MIRFMFPCRILVSLQRTSQRRRHDASSGVSGTELMKTWFRSWLIFIGWLMSCWASCRLCGKIEVKLQCNLLIQSSFSDIPEDCKPLHFPLTTFTSSSNSVSTAEKLNCGMIKNRIINHVNRSVGGEGKLKWIYWPRSFFFGWVQNKKRRKTQRKLYFIVLRSTTSLFCSHFSSGSQLVCRDTFAGVIFQVCRVWTKKKKKKVEQHCIKAWKNIQNHDSISSFFEMLS